MLAIVIIDYLLQLNSNLDFNCSPKTAYSNDSAIINANAKPLLLVATLTQFYITTELLSS